MNRPLRSEYLLFILTMAVTVSLFSFACGIKKPQMPSWMTTWDLPLANRAYSVSDIFDRLSSHNLAYDDNGDPMIQIIQPIDNVTVDQSLILDSAEVDLMDSVGLVEIESPADIQSNLKLSDIGRFDSGFVPPASFDINRPLERFDNFSWAAIEQGLMNITFHNVLEIDLDTLIITIMDSTDMHVIGLAAFRDGVSYLETETQEIDISGQTISNAIIMRCHGHTPGGVLINSGEQRLEGALTFPENFIVSAARARTPELTRTQSGIYEIDDSTKILSAVIDSGQLALEISNSSELPFDVTLHSPNFNRDGSDFVLSRSLQPHGFSNIAIDLAGYTFSPDDSAESQLVTIEMTNTVHASGQDEYTFHSSDSLNLHVDVSNILFESLNGRIEAKAVAINPITRDMDLPDGMSGTRLNRATFTLTIRNNSMIPAFADVMVSGNGKDIHFRGPIAAKDNLNSFPVTTILDGSEEEVSLFLDPPPEEMIISGQGIINPNYEIVTVRKNDSFDGEIEFQTALAFAAEDTVDIDPIVSRIPLDSRPDNFGREFGYGAFEARLINHLPVGVELTFFVGHSPDSSLLDDPAAAVLGPYLLTPAITDSNGYVTQAVSLDISDSLDNRALELLRDDSLFFGERARLLPTQPSGVVITGDDNISIDARAEIEMLVGGD
jgi:hypothetical protein